MSCFNNLGNRFLGSEVVQRIPLAGESVFLIERNRQRFERAIVTQLGACKFSHAKNETVWLLLYNEGKQNKLLYKK